MSPIVDEDRWHKFFELYRNLPEVWEINSDAYKDRHKRNRGWRLLLEMYRKIDKNASMDRMKHRINNIRTCYRRELKKIRQSKQYDNCSDSVHVPSLWYFHHLDFLKDQEPAQTRRWRLPSDPIRVEEHMNIDAPNELQNWRSPEPKLKRYKSKPKLPKRDVDQWYENSSSDNAKDEADIYGDSWACSYRKLSAEQQLYAKKAIEEILIMGQLNALSLDIVNSSLKVADKTEFEEFCDPNTSVYSNEEMCCIEEK